MASMTGKDPEIDIIDDTISSVVLAHQWEPNLIGFAFGPEGEVAMRCSCGEQSITIPREAMELAVTGDSATIKQARAVHQRHLLDKLGGRLHELFNVPQGTAALR